MIKQKLLRRLEILEAQTIPEGEPELMTVNFIDAQTKEVTSQLQLTLGRILTTQQHRRQGQLRYPSSGSSYR